jgi:hypothetical protein
LQYNIIHCFIYLTFFFARPIKPTFKARKALNKASAVEVDDPCEGSSGTGTNVTNGHRIGGRGRGGKGIGGKSTARKVVSVGKGTRKV